MIRQNRQEKQRRKELQEATVSRARTSKEVVVKVTPPPYLPHNSLASKLDKEKGGMPVASAPKQVMEGAEACPTYWGSQPTDPLFPPYSDDEYSSDY